jgi:small GTP-binding protein
MIGPKFDQSVKTVVVGDSGVGKTCLLVRFTSGTFEDDTPSTLGVEFLSKIIETKTRRIELQLWDTAGQELFRAVTRGYYRGSIGAFLVFDVTRRESFTNITRWISEVQSAACSDAILILLGNKIDLREARVVTTEEATKFANENGLLYFETSACTGEGIEKGMLACIDAVEKLIDAGRYDGTVRSDMFVLGDEDASGSSQKKCC